MVLKRRGWAKWLAWSFLLFTVAFARTAAATEIQYTLSDIMAQKITGDFSAVQDVVGTVAKANAGGCQLTFTGQNEISWTRTDCQALFEREPLVDLTFAAASGFKTTIAVGSTITLKPKMAAAPPPIVEIDKEALRVKTPPAGTKPYVYRFVGKELTKLTVDPNNGSFNVTAKDLGPNLKLYAEFDKEGTDLAGFVALDVTALAALEPKGNEKRPPAEPDDTEDFCVREPGDPEYVVCADLVPETENRTIEMLGPKGFVTSHVMVPNRAVIVKVRHEDTQSLEIKIKGDRGLVKPRLNDQAREAKPTKELTAVGKSEVSHLVTTRRFGPRQVGEVDITVAAKWKAQDGTEKKREELVELMVEETYFGALRIGVATVLGGATEQSFGVRSINGSKQPEIVPTSTGDADFELVLGFAPYVFDYLFLGGPRPAITSRGAWVAPYFGVGLVSVDSKERAQLDFLKSIHLGLEVEFVSSFSVAGTLVLRRVERLADDVHIGSPVSGSDAPTQQDLGVGGGLVLNFSPDFLKLAAQGAGGVL